MRIIDLIATANHNLFRNKTRTFLTILAVFIGSFTIILSNAINAGVNDFVDKQVASVGGDGFIEVIPASMYEQFSSSTMSVGKVVEHKEGTANLLNSKITEADLNEMRAIDGVKTLEIFHILSIDWLKPEGSTKKYDGNVEYFPTSEFKVDISAGRMPDNNSSEYEILMNENWLEPFGLEKAEDMVGKTVEISISQTAKCYVDPKDCSASVTAKVVGVQAPGILSMSGDLHINKALDQKLYALSMVEMPEGSGMNYLAVGEVEPEKMGAIREKLRDMGFEFITIDDAVGMIRTFLDAVLVVFSVFGGIALIAASIGIINTLFMAVQERTREIGLMKAMGMSQPKIFAEFSLEAILLGFWGSLVGIALSMLVGFIGNNIAHSTFLSDFPTFDLVKFQPLNMAIIILIIMFIAFIAGVAPARRASRKNPIDALRYE